MIWILIFLSFAWAAYDEWSKNNKQHKLIKRQREHEALKEAYFKQKAESLKTKATEEPNNDPHQKYKPDYKPVIREDEPLTSLKEALGKLDDKENAKQKILDEFTRKREEDSHLKYKPVKQNTVVWSNDFVLSLEWKRYEEVCCELLKVKGYNAETTGIGADGGIDIVVKNDNGLVVSIAQCKAFGKKPIGVALIRELFGVMASEKVANGLFFTTSTFSNDAMEFAKNKPIKLIDLRKFVNTINALNSDRQEWLYKVATQADFTTPTCPRCDVSMVKRVNNFSNTAFWGCVNFPKCRKTMKVRA